MHATGLSLHAVQRELGILAELGIIKERETHEDLAKVTYPLIPAEAGIQNSFNPAPSGTGFRVARRLPGMTIPS